MIPGNLGAASGSNYLENQNSQPPGLSAAEAAVNDVSNNALSRRPSRYLKPTSPLRKNRVQKKPLDPANLIRFPERKIPPFGASDTYIGAPGSNGWTSAHGQATVFKDEEIIRYHPFLGEAVPIAPDSYILAGKTGGDKYVIQQQANRGCTAAVAAMLIFDLGKTPNLFRLRHTNLGKDQSMIDHIKEAGLEAIVQQATSINHLQQLLIQSGSAIVSIESDEIGGHVVVVDCIDSEGVTLRDPYHGWKITVKQDAFLKLAYFPYRIIQVAQK